MKQLIKEILKHFNIVKVKTCGNILALLDLFTVDLKYF